MCGQSMIDKLAKAKTASNNDIAFYYYKTLAETRRGTERVFVERRPLVVHGVNRVKLIFDAPCLAAVK